MTQNISIEVDLDSLESTQNIVGNVYFIIDYHRFFPDEGWSDFVVIILSWWIKSLKGLMVSQPNTTYEFDFMDGSPIIFAKRIENSNLELLFSLDADKTKSVALTAVCSLNDLKESLLSVSKKVIRAIERKKWHSKEIDELKDLVLSLERFQHTL